MTSRHKAVDPHDKDTSQLSLFNAHTPESLAAFLRSVIGCDLQLTLTDNTASMLSARKNGTGYGVRMHRMFLHADEEVLHQSALFIAGRIPRAPLLRSFINSSSRFIQKKPRKRSITTQGKAYCLLTIFDLLNAEYFSSALKSRITWGRRTDRRYRRQVTLGSYNLHADTITINRRLDSLSVPKYFVEFIVYHEMLHALLGVDEKNGRNVIHSKEFRRMEKKFAHYQKAIDWEKKKKS
ncbi:MAG: M48 family metallopeptidase [Nitrospirae bacterium]|nr:M48 family metallopeptidase [Nitrospirota bacterium]